MTDTSRPISPLIATSAVDDLIAAAKRGDLNTVHALLDAGANVNAQCSTAYSALMWAARAGVTAQMRLLLDRGADPNLAACRPNGTTVLLESALFWDSTEPIRLLLDAGAAINAQNSHGSTALMRAAFRADTAQVRLLLLRGADPTLRNNSGRTALDCTQAEAVAAPEANSMKAAEVKRLLCEAEEGGRGVRA